MVNMKNMKTKAIPVLLVSMVVASLLTPIAISFAENGATTTTDSVPKLMARALALQSMVRKSLMLNLSAGLASEIQKLVNTNVSSLTVEELRQFIERCKEVLARVEQEIRNAWSIELGNVYAEKLRKTIEVRARVMEKLCNVSLNDVLANVSRARDRVELMKALRYMDRVVEKARLKMFATLSIKHVELSLNTTIGKPEARTVARAYEELGRVVDVLKRVANKLGVLNISDAVEAIENINIAIEHLSIARKILVNISANISVSTQTQTMERIRERVREVVNKTLEKLYEQVNRSLYELKKEVEELTERAIEVNATEIVEKLEPIAQKLEEIEKELQQTNISIVELNSIAMLLAKIKVEIKKIEILLEKELKEVPAIAIDNAFNVTLTKAVKNLNELKNMYSFVEKKSKEIVCIAIYPPPPACRFLIALPTLLKHVNETITVAEDMINKSIEMYNSGDKVGALHMVAKANAMIMIAKAQLQPIYSLLKASEVTRGRSNEELRNDLDKRLNSSASKLNSLEKILESIKNRLEKRKMVVARATVEKLINDVENSIKNAKELINEALSSIEKNDLENTSAIILRIDAIVKDVELKINMLQRII